jgi:hypothetical protein
MKALDRIKLFYNLLFFNTLFINYYYEIITLNYGIYVYNLSTKSDNTIECLGIGSILRTFIRKNF